MNTTKKRVRPYTRHIPLGKDCEICGSPIFSNRRDRVSQAVTCSYECFRKWSAKRMKDHPPRLGKFQVERTIGSEGYAFLNINRLSPELKVLARAMMLKGNYIQEHRIVMAGKLGRALLRNETVHHRDGNRINNSIENLELWVGSHSSGKRAADLTCPHCGKSYA